MRFSLAAALIGWAILLPASDTVTFHTSIAFVKADVEVYDRQTRAPISGLKASDFTVLDENEPREIAYFGSESGPLDLLLLLDVSGSVREVLPKIADSAGEALSTLQQGDRAAVMAFSKTIALTQPMTSEFGAIARGIRGALSVRIGLDTDINQALWSAANYLHDVGGSSRRAVLIVTDNMQETHIPDSLVDEQLADAGAVVDGLLVRGPVALPHIMHPGILGFARNSGGEVIEGNQSATYLAEMTRRIKLRYSIHFRPVESESAPPGQLAGVPGRQEVSPRRIRIELTAEVRRRYPHAVVRARRIYFPLGRYRAKPQIPRGQKVG